MILALLLSVTIDATACASSSIDNCPKATATTDVASITTASFSTTNSAELIVAVASLTGTGTSATAIAISASGGSFSTAWTRAKGCANGTTVDVEVWYAITSAALSSRTITATFTRTTTKTAQLTVIPFSASDISPVNIVSCATGSATAAAMSFTPESFAGILVGAGGDSGTATARTMASGNTKVNEVTAATGTSWGNYVASPSAGVSTTFGTTAPTASTVWALVLGNVTLYDTATTRLALAPQLRTRTCAVNGDCTSLGTGSICDLGALLCTGPTNYQGFYPGASPVVGPNAGVLEAKLPWGKCSALNVTPGGQGACYGASGQFGKAIR